MWPFKKKPCAHEWVLDVETTYELGARDGIYRWYLERDWEISKCPKCSEVRSSKLTHTGNWYKEQQRAFEGRCGFLCRNVHM